MTAGECSTAPAVVDADDDTHNISQLLRGGILPAQTLIYGAGFELALVLAGGKRVKPNQM